MKKCILIIILGVYCIGASSQSQEVQQLLLNWEKLTQFKKILQNMKDGYELLHKGYKGIKDISKGNFNLHQTFLDGLMQVSPAVRKYKRITDIIQYQIRIVRECQGGSRQFKEDGQFTLTEIDYLAKVYANLLDQSLQNIEELLMVTTAGRLRMSDDERLQAIDRIYITIEDQFSFLKEFNNNTKLLSLRRKSEQAEINLSKRVYGY